MGATVAWPKPTLVGVTAIANGHFAEQHRHETGRLPPARHELADCHVARDDAAVLNTDLEIRR